MKDSVPITLCVAAGLVAAFFVSKPLRQPASSKPTVGTPLRQETQEAPASDQVYARGTIDLAPGLKTLDLTTKALFIIARPQGGRAPVAVKKLPIASFPMKFQLSAVDNMTGFDFYEGPLTIIARLDDDGIAGPKAPEDREVSMDATPENFNSLTLYIP